MVRRHVTRCLIVYQLLGLSLCALAKDDTPNSPPAGLPEFADVVIAGAGLSGLLTAYLLPGRNAIIVEASGEVGGRVSSQEFVVEGEPIRVNTGMEEFWQSNPIVDVIKQLGLPTLEHNAASSVIIKGKLHAYNPNETKSQFIARIFGNDTLAELDAMENKFIEILTHFRNSKHVAFRIANLMEDSFSDLVETHTDNINLREWIRQTIEPEIGTSWDKISALDGLMEYAIFLKDGQKAYQIVGGNQILTDTLAKHIGTQRIFNHYKVEKVETEKNNGEVTLSLRHTQTGVVHTLRTAHFVSTIPVPQLFKHVEFSPPLPLTHNQAMGALQGGSYHKVNILLSAAGNNFFRSEKGDSILPILTDGPLGVIYNANTLPSENVRALMLLIHGKRTARFDKLSNEQRILLVREELEKLFPGISATIVSMSFLQKPPKSIAAWGPGSSRFDERADLLRTPLRAIYFAGDFTESTHSDGAIRSAMRVASQIQQNSPVINFLPHLFLNCSETFSY